MSAAAIAPFLILGLGVLFCLIVWAGRDNKVVRQRSLSVTIRASVEGALRGIASAAEAFARIGLAMNRARLAAADFETAMAQMQATLDSPYDGRRDAGGRHQTGSRRSALATDSARPRPSDDDAAVAAGDLPQHEGWPLAPRSRETRSDIHAPRGPQTPQHVVKGDVRVTSDRAAVQGGSSREPDTGGSAASLEDALDDLRSAIRRALEPLLLPALRVIDDAARRLPAWVTGGGGR